jgi:succinate dehydrogenase/fumarate reductase iron-sulfur protein
VGIRTELNRTMESGAGICRTEASLRETCDTIRQLQRRFADVVVTDRSQTFNTELTTALELGFLLDALNYIKDYIDGTLAYRWSCRMGVCGSCGMMVNGVPRLTCSAFLREWYPHPIRVEPLTHFPVIRDLIINMDDFMHKLTEVKAWLIPKEGRPVSEGEYLQTPAELAHYQQFSLCINCMLCYAACPIYGLDPKFIYVAWLIVSRVVAWIVIAQGG